MWKKLFVGAATLAEVLGRELGCVELSDGETREQMVADGTPQEYIEAFFANVNWRVVEERLRVGAGESRR